MEDNALDLFNKKERQDMDLQDLLDECVKSSREVKNAVITDFKNGIRIMMSCNHDVYNLTICYVPPEFGPTDLLYLNDDTTFTPMGADRIKLYLRYLSSYEGKPLEPPTIFNVASDTVEDEGDES